MLERCGAGYVSAGENGPDRRGGPRPGFGGLFIALYGGLFAAQGLHVTFVPATSSETAIAAQVKGAYDITAGNYVSYIQAQQAGSANLDIFAEGSVMEPGAQDLYTAEQTDGAVPLADLNQGATTNFPVEGYVVTKQWAKKYPHTLAAFCRALEQAQQIADTNRAAVEQAMRRLPATPEPLSLSAETAALISLDNYPFSAGPVGTIDKIRLQRVVNVMHQFLGFPANFNINSMLLNGG